MIRILLAALLCTGLSFAAHGASHKLRVQDRDLAKQLVERGGKVLGDYDSFQIIETQETQPTDFRRTRTDKADESDFIELNSVRLNTRAMSY